MPDVNVTLIQAHPVSVGGSLAFDGSPWREPLSSQRYPPLGLLYLAGALDAAGVAMRVIDARYHADPAAAIDARLADPRPCLVGLSLTSFDLPGALATIRRVRRARPDATVVVGGSHITHMPRTADFLGADFGVRGDGERAIVALAKAVAAGSDPAAPGLFRARAPGADQVPIHEEPDLDRVAVPDLLKVPADAYAFPLHSGPATTMIASRGCTYGCVFCGIPHRRSHRQRSVHGVVEEMALREAQGFRYIDFKDDCFSLDLARAKDLCRVIRARGLRIEWGCETRLDRLDEEFVELARAAGCLNIKVGIESGADHVRDRIGKRLGIDGAREIFAVIRRNGLISMAYFLFGHPEERKVDMRATVSAALSLDPDIAEFLLAVPVPGTPLLERAVVEGQVSADVWHDVARGGLIPVYVPRGVTLAQMESLRRGAYRRFYLRPHVLARHLRLHSSSAASLARAAAAGAQLLLRHGRG